MDLDKLLPPGSIDALASQLGISHEQARQGAEGLLPSLLHGFGQAAGGAQAPHAERLGQQLNALGGPALAENVTGPQRTDTVKGDQLLGTLFGSKEVSRQVAGHVAQSTGLGAEVLKNMLPILAMLVAGHMARQSGGSAGGFGAVLGSVLGGAGGAGGGLGGVLGSLLAGAH